MLRLLGKSARTMLWLVADPRVGHELVLALPRGGVPVAVQVALPACATEPGLQVALPPALGWAVAVMAWAISTKLALTVQFAATAPVV